MYTRLRLYINIHIVGAIIHAGLHASSHACRCQCVHDNEGRARLTSMIAKACFERRAVSQLRFKGIQCWLLACGHHSVPSVVGGSGGPLWRRGPLLGPCCVSGNWGPIGQNLGLWGGTSDAKRTFRALWANNSEHVSGFRRHSGVSHFFGFGQLDNNLEVFGQSRPV